jgi:hypothetical protein
MTSESGAEAGALQTLARDLEAPDCTTLCRDLRVAAHTAWSAGQRREGLGGAEANRRGKSFQNGRDLI